jgi:hypothetical protein
MAKAGRPKKGSARLPAWFDVKKYAPVRDFSAKDWFQQLSLRRELFEAIKPDGKPLWYTSKRYVPKFLDLIMRNPVVTSEAAKNCISSRRQSQRWRDVAIEVIFDTIFEPEAYVRHFANCDVPSLYHAFEEGLKKLAAGAKIPVPTVKLEEPFGIETPANLSEQAMNSVDRFLMSSVDDRHNFILSVNMSAPNEILIGEFEDLLKTHRKAFGEAPSPIDKSRDFADWFKCGILPYLDLKLWELVKGESFHWATFGETLTGITRMRYGSESAHIKAVKACEQLLMNERTLRLLRSQAGREEAGYLKKSRKMSVRNSES